MPLPRLLRLALARHLGDRPLTGPGAPGGEDLIFFTVAPGRVVAYPAGWAGPWRCWSACSARGGRARPARGAPHLARPGRGRGGLPRRRHDGGGAASIAWWAIKALDPDHQVFLIGVAYNADVFHAGLVALVVAAVSGLYAVLGRWVHPAAAAPCPGSSPCWP